MKEWLEQPTVIDDKVKAIQEEEAGEKKNRDWYRKIKWMSALLIVMILALAVGIYAFLQYRENLREKESLSVDDAVEFLTPGETAYEDYARLLESHGILKPKSSFSYNVEIPKEEREKLDPLWQDVYLGFEENRDLTATLFKLKDGDLFLMYDTKTGEVISATPWKKDINQELALEILRTKGEKAQTTQKAAKATDLKERERLKEEIDNLNDKLAGLYDELTQTLH